ncbi:MAG TPA: thiaminase II [Solirubrobacteraceae bacterium]|nr:thiaminase II [Solirubrobacteraceae bacterium]
MLVERPNDESAGRYSDELRSLAAGIWEAQHVHPFVQGIADGSLEVERFRHFVRQDYVYLIEYARLLSLACARAPRLEWMRRFAELAQSTLGTEMDMHRAFAAGWDITGEELEYERATPTTRAYTEFLLRTATLGDFSELVAALLPCMWGYAEVGQALAPRTEGNPYAAWIEAYASPAFAAQASWCRSVADELASGLDDAGRARMLEAFLQSSRHELAFWDMAWQLEGQA